MENITINNKNCIFLNHGKLINDLYQQHVDTDVISCCLKKQIFNFKPKTTSISSKAIFKSNDFKNNNKRKRNLVTAAETTNEEESQINLFIAEIQEKYLNSPQINDDLPRFWEEPQEFPQFRGANLTNEYQIAKFSQQNYIIPPKTKFFNYDIENLPKIMPELETYDLLIMDMPWQNKYIKRLKKVKTSLAYKMLDNETLSNLPISRLLHENSLVVLWCTNAQQHRQAIEVNFLPKWNLQLVHKMKWFKINTSGELISTPKSEGYKQPYELLYIACPKERDLVNLKELTMVEFLISIPSIIHSHKPPLVEWLKQFLLKGENFKGLEIFARYLQPQFTSVGLEVLKLMDKRLYDVDEDVEKTIIGIKDSQNT